MATHFCTIDEQQPGIKWQQRHRISWPAYREWYLSKGMSGRPASALGRQKLQQYMPELVSTYDRLCELVGDDDLCHRFLTLYDPPRLAVACSQLVWPGVGGPALIRNYDFSPNRWEAVLQRSQWNQRTVIGMSDCLWGLLDGINQSGLSVSLAFGGDPKVGPGFAIPLIVRYLLETCASVHEAKDALRGVPSFMTYTLTMVDAGGDHTTAYLMPGRKPRFEDSKFATNHQGDIRWPQYARYTRTIERGRFLERRLNRPNQSVAGLLQDFLAPPLYASAWNRGFGTLYTALYQPLQRSLELVWPHTLLTFSTAEFAEVDQTLEFGSNTPQQAVIAY